jgi:hypothetical protein
MMARTRSCSATLVGLPVLSSALLAGERAPVAPGSPGSAGAPGIDRSGVVAPSFGEPDDTKRLRPSEIVAVLQGLARGRRR